MCYYEVANGVADVPADSIVPSINHTSAAMFVSLNILPSSPSVVPVISTDEKLSPASAVNVPADVISSVSATTKAPIIFSLVVSAHITSWPVPWKLDINL